MVPFRCLKLRKNGCRGHRRMVFQSIWSIPCHPTEHSTHIDPSRASWNDLKRSETIWNDLKHCLTAGAKTLDCLDCSKVHMAGDFILSLCQDRAWLGAWWRIFFCRRKRYPPQQVWDKVDQGSSTLVKTCQNHPESETALRRMSCSLQPGSTKRNCRWRLRSCMQSSEDMRFFIVEASIVQCYFVGN